MTGITVRVSEARDDSSLEFVLATGMQVEDWM